MARRITPAVDQLVEQLRVALVAAAVDEPLLVGAVATTDPSEAQSAALAGGSLLIGPPSIDWTEYLGGGLDVVWTIQAAANGGAAGPRHAWDRLDALLDVVAEVVTIDRADPGRAPVAGSDAVLHVYRITTDPTTLDPAN